MYATLLQVVGGCLNFVFFFVLLFFFTFNMCLVFYSLKNEQFQVASDVVDVLVLLFQSYERI